MEDIKLSIGKRISQERKKNELSAAELARRAGISRGRLNNWESGRRTPGLDESKTLASILNCSPAYLLCLTDIYNPKDTDEHSEKRLFETLPIKEKDLILSNSIPNTCIPIPDQFKSNIKKDMFLFKIFDESMTPIFSPGDYVTINPIQKPSHNDYVLVQIESSGQILFRKYTVDHTNIHLLNITLVPLNKDWPEINTKEDMNVIILGVMLKNNKVFF